MKKTYENSHLEWLTQKDIEANNESEFYVIVQVSEKIACPVIRIENNLQCEICFLCEVVDREEYEKPRRKGKSKNWKKKIHKLKEEKDLSSAIDQLIADIEAGRKYMKVYKQMKMYNDPALNPVLYGKK